MEFQLIVSSEQEAFNGADFGFSIDWNLQIKLFKVNYWMFWLDDLSVEIFLRKDSEKVLGDSKILSNELGMNLGNVLVTILSFA